MLTEKQKELISYLRMSGYGWAKFAASVESQGWCSEKQEQTMIRMKQRVRNQAQRVMAARSNWRNYKHDISDCEAMSFGEYF